MLVNWQLMGYMMVIYIAGLQNVPPELIEASQIDGASRWQTLRNVTLPMIMPSDHHLPVPHSGQHLQDVRPEPRADQRCAR